MSRAPVRVTKGAHTLILTFYNPTLCHWWVCLQNSEHPRATCRRCLWPSALPSILPIKLVIERRKRRYASQITADDSAAGVHGSESGPLQHHRSRLWLRMLPSLLGTEGMSPFLKSKSSSPSLSIWRIFSATKWIHSL